MLGKPAGGGRGPGDDAPSLAVSPAGYRFRQRLGVLLTLSLLIRSENFPQIVPSRSTTDHVTHVHNGLYFHTARRYLAGYILGCAIRRSKRSRRCCSSPSLTGSAAPEATRHCRGEEARAAEKERIRDEFCASGDYHRK